MEKKFNNVSILEFIIDIFIRIGYETAKIKRTGRYPFRSALSLQSLGLRSRAGKCHPILFLLQ